MPINMSCPSCGKTLAAPDSAAGKRAKCPACSQIMIVPDVQPAEEVGGLAPPLPSASSQTSAGSTENWLDSLSGASQTSQTSAASPGGEQRRPCPECGEMIVVGAAKCRFCNAIFDPRLRGRGYRALNLHLGPPSELVRQIQQCFTIWWVCYAIGAVLCFAGGALVAVSHTPALFAVIILGALIMLAGGITYLVLLYKLWTTVQDGRARTTPGCAVGFLFIPCFNIYWQFVAFWGLSKELNRVSREYNLGAPEAYEGLALAACILPFCTWVPVVGGLVGIAELIVVIIAVKNMCDVAVAIVGGPNA